MANFIVPELRNANIPIKQYNNKIKLFKNNVKLNIINTRDLGKIYRLKYMLNIFLPNNSDPNAKLTPRNVDMVSLKKAIENNIPSIDRKYIKITRFDTKNVILDFNIENWLKDATSNLKSKTTLTKFAREFKLKQAPPRIIMMDVMNDDFSKFVLRNFKKYVDEKNKGKEYFKYLIPKNLTYNLKKVISNMFEWSYDIQWNKITATLKTFWIMTLLYATTKAYNNKLNKEKYFSYKVNKKLSSFDKLKYEKYISKNKIFY